SVTIRAEFPNPDKLLLPGMFVRAQLQSGVRQNAILVPQQGVTRDQKGKPTAMVVNGEGKVELRELVTERALGADWLVSKGIEAGDKVITEGLQKVKPGASVTAKPAGNVASAEQQPAGKGQ
ncbi:HlyD family secretion protein, partial [Pseudomonas sp. BAV 4579]